jgi:hypothetical protein
VRFPQVQIDSTEPVPGVVVDGNRISLTALSAMSPRLLRLVEEISKPEADGQVLRVEHREDGVHLVRIGVFGHVVKRVRGI